MPVLLMLLLAADPDPQREVATNLHLECQRSRSHATCERAHDAYRRYLAVHSADLEARFLDAEVLWGLERYQEAAAAYLPVALRLDFERARQAGEYRVLALFKFEKVRPEKEPGRLSAEQWAVIDAADSYLRSWADDPHGEGDWIAYTAAAYFRDAGRRPEFERRCRLIQERYPGSGPSRSCKKDLAR